MASSVLSFLKSSASSAGQQATEKVKSDAADTRDQPEIEGTSLDYACMYGDERPLCASKRCLPVPLMFILEPLHSSMEFTL